MSQITEAVVARMKDVATEHGALDHELAKSIAQEFGIKDRAVIAAAPKHDVPYKRKERVSKTGDPVETKEDLVKAIEVATGFELDGLEKATKPVLQKLAAFLS